MSKVNKNNGILKGKRYAGSRNLAAYYLRCKNWAKKGYMVRNSIWFL